MTERSNSEAIAHGKISGIEIELGGEKYVVPPLNFKAVREHMDAISAMTTGVPLSSEQIDRSVALILAAMRRNYPQLTQDGLEELLDMANIKIVLPAILGASGFSRAGE
ncbi:MAG: hypothetical protein ACLQUZ_05455 [Rhizomicrobium sp.]